MSCARIRVTSPLGAPGQRACSSRRRRRRFLVGSRRRPSPATRSCDGPTTSPAGRCRPRPQSIPRRRRAHHPRTSTPQDELRHADLLQMVDATVEEIECLSCVLLGGGKLLSIEPDRRERRAHVAGVDRETQLDEHPERLFEQLDRAVVVAPEVAQTCEVVQQPSNRRAIAEIVEQLPRPFGVRSSKHPSPLSLSDERRLEQGVRGSPLVAHASASSRARSMSSPAANQSRFRHDTAHANGRCQNEDDRPTGPTLPRAGALLEEDDCLVDVDSE